jgi:hypothetical protein
MLFQLSNRDFTMLRTFPYTFTLAQVAIILSTGIFPLNAGASDQTINCPARIPASSFQFANAPEGWTPFVPSPLELTSAGFMQASPEKKAYLKPFTTINNNKRVIAVWKFEGDYPQGKWLTCNYAEGVVSISKEIARSTSECTITYEKKKKNQADYIQIICK